MGFRWDGEMYQLVRRRQTDPALEFLTTPGAWPEKSRIHAGFLRIAPSVIRCYSVAVNREFSFIHYLNIGWRTAWASNAKYLFCYTVVTPREHGNTGTERVPAGYPVP